MGLKIWGFINVLKVYMRLFRENIENRSKDRILSKLILKSEQKKKNLGRKKDVKEEYMERKFKVVIEKLKEESILIVRKYLSKIRIEIL